MSVHSWESKQKYYLCVWKQFFIVITNQNIMKYCDKLLQLLKPREIMLPVPLSAPQMKCTGGLVSYYMSVSSTVHMEMAWSSGSLRI